MHNIKLYQFDSLFIVLHLTLNMLETTPKLFTHSLGACDEKFERVKTIKTMQYMDGKNLTKSSKGVT